MILYLWICRDSKILKLVIFKIGHTYIEKSGIAGKVMVSYATLAWLGNEDVRPRTNSSMLRDPDVKSATGRANVARRAPRAAVFFILLWILEHKLGRLCNEKRKICFVYC